MRIKKATSAMVEPDMTPMIDVVFQLIAFFMIAINFENTKADERVKLPVDALAKPPEVRPEEELVLNIGFLRSPDGTLQDERPFIFYGDGSTYRVEEFGPKLEQEARLLTAKLGEDGPKEATVRIRADSEVPTGLIQLLIKMAQEAGFEKFAMTAQQQVEDTGSIQ